MVAALLWGMLWYPLRLLDDMGLPGLWSTLIIYCSAIVFLLPACWRKRADFLAHKTDYILIGVFTGWTNIAIILALLEGEVVRVLLLFYLSPIWAIILAALILKEKLTPKGACSLILAILGAGVMFWHPDMDYFHGFGLVDIYAITSGMAFAVTNVVVRKISEVPIIMKMGSIWTGVICLALCGLAITQPQLPELTIHSAALAFLIGFPMMYILTWTVQYGISHLPVQRSSIIFLLEIVVAAVSAALLTDEVVGKFEYIGGMFIISAGLISVIKEKNLDI